MTFQKTFYLSQILGRKIFDAQDNYLGKIKDLLIDIQSIHADNIPQIKPRLIGVKLKKNNIIRYISYDTVDISKFKGRYSVSCKQDVDLSEDSISNSLKLNANILDKQIVDINGRKLVRVNDIRIVIISSGAYVIAVDVGIEGMLRRIDIARPLQKLFSIFKLSLPSKFILWDDVETIDHSSHNIKLSKTSSKLHRLHPSDLADIIEDMGRKSKTNIFSSLDDEKAADVLEELEPHVQVDIIESLPVHKAADVLEKMPANEAADIIDELEEEKAEQLLKEMESESSEEVRELLEYPDYTVGSIMTTDYLSFRDNHTVEDALQIIRQNKPEYDLLYNLFITDTNEKLIATLSLRDLVVSEPQTELNQIMKKKPVKVKDMDRIDTLAEITSKYNLLAIPVINEDDILLGMVVIDDIVEDLVNKGRTNK